MRSFAIVAILLIAAILVWIALPRSSMDDPANPLVAVSGEDEIVLIDPAEPIQIEPPAEGWFHHKFLLRAPMHVSKATKDGVPALRCGTDASGSIFGRFTDIDIRTYPKLRWSWLVEKPIESELDERTIAGDDHPARLFLRFVDEEGEDHTMEIIWANKVFSPGDYKYIRDFPHYVAQSGDEAVGKWISEEVNLIELYERISERRDDARLSIAALFCDSDDTLTSSIAYFGKISLVRAGNS